VANSKVVIDPSKWIVDEDHSVSFRYRIMTNDLNVRSAFSPVYRVELPPITEMFSDVRYTVTPDTSNVSTVLVRLDWATVPVYDNFTYYVLVKKPGESDYSFVKSTTTTSFSYVVPSSEVGIHNIAVTIPTTTKTALTNARLIVASFTI
jgi:hypothetical protein